MTVVIVVAVAFIIIALFISMYNGLVKLRNNRENAFANIDVQLKQRFDLVPQLVSTVKGYATHEKQVLEEVTAARAAAINAKTRFRLKLIRSLRRTRIFCSCRRNFRILRTSLLLPAASSILQHANTTMHARSSRAISLPACSTLPVHPCMKRPKTAKR